MVEFITKDDFNELRKLDEKYWSMNRWNYIGDVIDILKEYEHQFEKTHVMLKESNQTVSAS